ncbi:MAG: YraN family protein [Planctomycetales bacterium]|nr:YraN family protein [Planctomycetales bacterium]
MQDSWLPWRRRTQTLGERGEAAAARLLKRLGYKIVGRGQRDGTGELDIVAVDLRDRRGPTVVFVEVKTRGSHLAGHPAEAVDEEKQRRLSRLALGYLKRHGLLEYPARFDVVAVTWPAGQKKPRLEHFPHAFEAPPELGQLF